MRKGEGYKAIECLHTDSSHRPTTRVGHAILQRRYGILEGMEGIDTGRKIRLWDGELLALAEELRKDLPAI